MEETLPRLVGGPHPEDVAGIISPEPADELRAGLESSAEDDVEAQRRAVRHALRVVEQDAEPPRRAGQLLAAADREAVGTSGIDTVAPMVAAVADWYDEPVPTADAAHVEALGVAVESY